MNRDMDNYRVGKLGRNYVKVRNYVYIVIILRIFAKIMTTNNYEMVFKILKKTLNRRVKLGQLEDIAYVRFDAVAWALKRGKAYVSVPQG